MLVNIFLKYSNNKKKYLGVHLHNLKYQYLSKKNHCSHKSRTRHGTLDKTTKQFHTKIAYIPLHFHTARNSS